MIEDQQDDHHEGQAGTTTQPSFFQSIRPSLSAHPPSPEDFGLAVGIG
jgi:hypothetical protein